MKEGSLARLAMRAAVAYFSAKFFFHFDGTQEMEMGHFFFTQPDPPAYRPNPTYLPAQGPTKPTHLTAKQFKASTFNLGVVQYMILLLIISSAHFQRFMSSSPDKQ